MDLGIQARHAIVGASSRGLGRACAEALAREGVRVTLNGRDPAALKEAVEAIAAEHGVQAQGVAGDIAAEETQRALLAACPTPDILVNNNGGPPPGRFADWGRDAWVGALEANMLAPLAMIRAALEGMRERRFGRIVNITSAMVKTPLALLAQVVSPARRQALLRRVAARNPRRLRPGDVVEASIRTDDGAIDLGVQRNKVVAGR